VMRVGTHSDGQQFHTYGAEAERTHVVPIGHNPHGSAAGDMSALKARQRRCTSLRIYDARRNQQGGSGGGVFHGCASRCAARANADTVQTQHAHRSENRPGS